MLRHRTVLDIALKYAEALKWYSKSAEQGNSEAQNGLGGLYEKGRGVPQDYVKAYMWFELAVAGFTATDAERREQMVQDRTRVAKRMSAAQIAEAEKLARKSKPK
jgi:uncharacterized protein